MQQQENNSMNTNTTIPSSSVFWSIFFFLLSVFALLASFFISIHVSKTIEENTKLSFLMRVKSSAYLINAQTVAGLSGSVTDLDLPQYQELKSIMVHLNDINVDTRFVYLMGNRGDKLFFFVDSEGSDSPDYSPPGQIYEDTNTLELSNYEKAVSFIEGPYHDKWGSWVSAYAPVLSNDGSIVAVLGMDIDASIWQKEISFAKTIIITVGVLLAFIFLITALYIRRSHTLMAMLGNLNMRLTEKVSVLSDTVHQAHIASWKLLPKTGDMSFDEEMYTLTGIKNGTRITLDTFKDLMGEDDRATFASLLSTSIDKRSTEFTQKISLRSLGNGIKVVKIVATLYYGAGEVPTVIHGTAQDITS